MTPFEIADALRACLDAAFTGDEGKPAEICHRPGAEVPFSLGLAQDECCSGLGWVRIAGIDPVIDPVQSEDADASPCDIYGRRITLEIGVARCNPFGTNQAGPDCDTWTELALRMDVDARRMRQAVCCLSTTLAADPKSYVDRVRGGAWEPLEASGLCAGGMMTVVVWLDCSDC
jgi:hypothetical protein